MGSHPPVPHSPYLQQLERYVFASVLLILQSKSEFLLLYIRLSLSSNYVCGNNQQIIHSTPIGFDLWQRHSNGIAHIDSEGDTSDTFGNQSSPSDENYFSASPSAQYCHPSSNYAYKKERKKQPAWHYPAGADIVKHS